MFHLSSATTRRAKRGMLREWRLHMLSIFSLEIKQRHESFDAYKA